MAVVYIHRDSVSKEPFYVGIGACRDRAFVRVGRNCDWEFLTRGKEFDVEILHEGISMDSARRIEVELITKYGRKDLGTGILVNKHKGGCGVAGGATEIKYTSYGNTPARKVFHLINNQTGKKYSSVSNASKMSGWSSTVIELELDKVDGIFSRL